MGGPTLNGDSAPGDFRRDAAFYWSDVGVVVASLAIWWIDRLRRVPTARLYVLGLLYEVTICFVIVEPRRRVVVGSRLRDL